MLISYNTLILYTVIFLLVGAAIGSWITRTLLRYPFGQGPLTGKDAMIGKNAKVLDKRRAILRVAINSQVWNAESTDFEMISKGDLVRVTAVENLTLKVSLPDERRQEFSSLPSREQSS